MNYVSVCSGIEAASVAWKTLGWSPAAFAEAEPFPSSVLAYRFPDVPNLGDITQFMEWDIEPGSADVLVGGTPCQSFSIAGLRGGLEDDRGNLALTYCRILDRFKFPWFVWENVPGVLSSNGGRDFGSIIGAMVELGYGVCWRVLDAQYFGVPQRRRRVFVVGCAGDWRSAAEVLFEPGCLRGDSPKGSKKRKDVARTPGASTCRSVGAQDADAGHLITSTGDKSHCLNAGGMGRQDYETETMVVGFNWQNGGGYGNANDGLGITENGTGPLSRSQVPAVANRSVGVRRLTPRECERLQGFPDDWTLVPHRGKPAADGPRYKSIGNSMAVPVMRWIGQRISGCKGLR